ncbi:MAG TPA: cyclic nucleotide-binding domain-containing protein [Thermodesulfobacteriota bacterium]|nr:cyclic nucleotide-binding domain-containing protein [Thermodesulfobacteriota bacterium]
MITNQLFRKFGRTFPAGTVLFREGDACQGMFIIRNGRVRLYRRTPHEEITIDHLSDGDFFGEMACLLGQPRSINAVVEEDSEILVVEPDTLNELFRQSGLGLKMLGNLASRLKKTYEIVGQLKEELINLKEKTPSA